jgi:hypothetical protein
VVTAPQQDPPQVEDATLPSLALREADTSRAVRGYFGGALACLLAAVALQTFPQRGVLHWLLTAACVVSALSCGWLYWSRRAEGVYSDHEATFVGVMVSITALIGAAYLGPFAPIAAALVILIIVFSMGDEYRGRRNSIIIAVGYGFISVMAWLGYIDPVLAGIGERTVPLGAAFLFVEALFGVAYMFGVGARRSTEQAIEHVQRARVVVAGQQALLNEAFVDLRRLGGGGRGRLSGGQLGDYRLGEVLGRGGMGEVYRAKNLHSGLTAAVKVLQPNLVADPVLVKRFFREAEISSNLNSKHIVAVQGHGVAADGSPFLVMDLLQGRTMAEMMREQPRFKLGRAVEMVTEVASGLSTAHAAGIVHRDIKPGNLMYTDDGVWKVLDFGISKLMSGTGTMTHDPIGTPGYMPPEQAMGKHVDHRADVFALGAVLYRAVTGRPPFSGQDAVAAMLTSIERQPVRPGSIVDLPADVDAVVAIALAKGRDARFDSAVELANAFADGCLGKLSEDFRRRARSLLDQTPWEIDVLVTRSVHELSTDTAPTVVAED